jgi:thymidylate kinase
MTMSILPRTLPPVVLVGCYASGKSTLAERLSEATNLRYYPEIGGELRKIAKCTSSQSCAIFDELVMLRELERDERLLRAHASGEVILLEQWHPGNLAYASIRSNTIVSEYLSRLETANTLIKFRPSVVLLDMDPALISSRVRYENSFQRAEDLAFFSKWRIAIEDVFEKLSISPIRVEADRDPVSVYEQTISRLLCLH